MVSDGLRQSHLLYVPALDPEVQGRAGRWFPVACACRPSIQVQTSDFSPEL